ncbi:Aflatoxin B1 aldehyde reductase member 2 [Pseudohyphozyma bogoriensis]|nr:Aflatoxin B1 aldehyde reductase member 2 [Pseudohyphozyma bogoriensis]
MTAATIPSLLLGTSNIGPTPLYTHHDPAVISSLVSTWRDQGGDRLDTAAVYGVTEEFGNGGSERCLKDAGLEGWTVDTKVVLGFGPGSLADDKITTSVNNSLANLDVKKVNILYLHGPDRTTPVLHILQQLDALYQEGKFTYLGLSNFSAEEVEDFCTTARAHHLVPPKVYQGNYSALCRRGEPSLFPILRKYNMSFYAYSPLAMGLLTGGAQKESLEAARTLPPCSRFHPDSRKASVFQKTWFHEGIFDAVKLLNKLSRESGIPPVELALRWLAHHSALKAELGDAIILGASSNKQLEETVASLRGGPLDDKLVDGFEQMWDVAKDDAPEYYFTD